MKRLVVILPFALLMGGCSSFSSFMTGLSGSSDKLSCPLSEGVTCKPMSQVYEESAQGRTVASKAGKPDTADREEGSAPSRSEAAASRRLVRVTNDGEPTPLRSRPNTQRMWIAAWQDADDDLHEDAWIVVRLDDGDWMLDYVRDRVRSEFTATLKAPPAADTAEAGEDKPQPAPSMVAMPPALTPMRGTAGDNPAAASQPFVPTR
ncbi:MAG: type IV conjugative transfer system lipoprotein TraV [Gallionellaceae bacterium]|nr:type IV conjugative transfer system lipoprotein TraV [Gallionellaceae bacterium]